MRRGSGTSPDVNVGRQAGTGTGDRSYSFREQAAMGYITSDMKVAEVIRRYPATTEVFLARGCPDMRRGFFNLMARLMSVRNAARVHKIELGSLLEDLNKVAQGAARQKQ